MIKKSVIITILLFTAYSLYVALLAPDWWQASQSQWQDNSIKAQRFLYGNNNSCKNIIIGSSLSSRLITDSLPDTYNLAFSGQSVYDGLAVLIRKEILPSNVFIEMNVVLRAENKNFTSALNSPILFYSRKADPALRDDKQPITIAGSMCSKKITGRFIRKIKSFLHISENVENENKNKEELFTKMLNLQIENYSSLPDQRLLDEQFSKLKMYVEKLKIRGCNVVFYEMPVDSHLEYLPLAKIIRERFYMNFPSSRYKYIPFPGSIEYRTTDGVHLNKIDALKYTLYFRDRCGL